jgi:hypothetical protein
LRKQFGFREKGDNYVKPFVLQKATLPYPLWNGRLSQIVPFVSVALCTTVFCGHAQNSYKRTDYEQRSAWNSILGIGRGATHNFSKELLRKN